MKCPHCSFDNKDDAPFCEGCGHVFLTSDRVPEVPDPAERERRRGAALGAVPAVLKVPDVVAPAAAPSVADLADPLPDMPREPDFSGFERLVDSSYVPPAAEARVGDTAEIPVIRDEYVPRAHSYTIGPSERELRRRERQQRRLAKKFEKQQAKQERREARRAEKEAAKAARRAAKAGGEGTGGERDEMAAQTEGPAVAAACAASDRHDGITAETQKTTALSPAATGSMLSEDEVRAWKQSLGEGPLALGAPGLDAVLLTGDGVVGLFERNQERLGRRVRPADAAPQATAALELPGAEQGIVVAGERGIDVAGKPAAATAEDAGATSALAPLGEAAVSPLATTAAEEGPAAEGAGAARTAVAAKPEARKDAEARKAVPDPAPKADRTAAAKTSSASAASAARARGRARRVKVIVAAAVVAAVVLAGAGAAFGTYTAELWGGKTIPSVVGLTQEEATAKLAEKGFGCEVTEVTSDEAAGMVLAASPAAGQRADEGTVITLEVAVPRVMPAVVGMTQQEAQDALAAAGYTAVEVTQQKSNEAEGAVLAVSPEAGTVARADDPVTLTVAVPFTVPDVAGMDTDAAKEALAAEGYEVTTLWSYTEDTPEGTALYTEPEAGAQLASGSDVTLYIAKSRGKELVALAESFLPGARLKNNEGRFIIDSVKSVAYAGDDVVRYTCEAHQYEDVELPFGKGTTRVEDDKRVTIEGSLTFNSDDVVTTADPAIKY